MERAITRSVPSRRSHPSRSGYEPGKRDKRPRPGRDADMAPEQRETQHSATKRTKKTTESTEKSLAVVVFCIQEGMCTIIHVQPHSPFCRSPAAAHLHHASAPRMDSIHAQHLKLPPPCTRCEKSSSTRKGPSSKTRQPRGVHRTALDRPRLEWSSR